MEETKTILSQYILLNTLNVEYVKLLVESESNALAVANAYGYRTPKVIIDRGSELRQSIGAVEDWIKRHES